MFSAVVLSGCNGSENTLEDGDKHVSEEMNEVISDYIIQKNSTSFEETDKKFEVHKVYGTSEKDGVITVYMWSLMEGYNKATGTDVETGQSVPVVIRLSEKDENYSVVEYTESEDGSEYSSSLEEMFPKKYLKYALRDTSNVRDLQKEMDEKVKQWLKK